MDGRRSTVWLTPRAYRCKACGETSPEVYSSRELDELRHTHRMTAHGGFIPDGEVVLQPERLSLAELPREQWVIGGLILAVVILSAVAKMA